VAGTPMLDLCYEEDSAAGTDMNVVMGNDEQFIEVQGTAETAAFSRAELNSLLDLAGAGIQGLMGKQAEALGGILAELSVPHLA